MQLTKKEVNFSKLECTGHLYSAKYNNGKLAIYAGEDAYIDKLSVNLVDLTPMLKDNQFFVKCYGETINDECFETGLFEKIGEPFQIDNSFGTFQLWELKED